MLILFFILLLVLTTAENYYREAERFRSDISPKAGITWHILQLLALVITFMYIVIFEYGFSLHSISILFLLGAVWFICFDGGLNLFRGLPFFRESTTSTDPFRFFGKPVIKLVLLVIAIISLILNK